MPNTAKSSSAWRDRMIRFAHGESFSRGERPPKSSAWSKELLEIETCPRHKSFGRKIDVAGRQIVCHCGYHEIPLKTPKIRTVTTTSTLLTTQPTITTTSPTLITKPAITTTRSTIATTSTTSPFKNRFQYASSTITSKVSTQTKVPPIKLVSTTSRYIIKGMPHKTQPEEPLSVSVSPPSKSPTVQSPVSPKKSPPMYPRQPTDYSNRLPKGWLDRLLPADKQWLGHALFTSALSDEKYKTPLKHWHYPPHVTDIDGKPNPDKYTMRRLFFWYPRLMYKFKFQCVDCKRDLVSRGNYQKLRLVLDIKDYYYLATEALGCTSCNISYISTDPRIITQLPSHLQLKFPAILTKKYACDKSIVSLLKSRTLGNSSHALKNNLLEMHSENWMKHHIEYLAACENYKKKLTFFGNKDCEFLDFPDFPKVPLAPWFIAAYVKDVWSRLDEVKAQITSVFGEILKIDSTKKILNKLSGDARKTATWVTNIGNEYGALLQCVVTSSESNAGLEKMAIGIQERYRNANVEPPKLLYTDRDCCGEAGTRFNRLFSLWVNMLVRLDIWHFMRRIAFGCTSESHPLYPSFMRQLSACIFEWDEADYKLLCAAKEKELKASGIKRPTDEAISKAITKSELAKHCRRRTRGVEATTKSLEELILSYTPCTDSLGVPLFKETMVEVFNTEKQHIKCIQDPDGISLYTQIGTVKKGDLLLPKYRCARGSTSLEAFHHHLHQFIPGTRANALNFQAYLLEGLARWNTSRKDDISDESLHGLRSFDVSLVQRLNDLHKKVHGNPFNNRKPPNAPTNELIGMEYLYQENAISFPSDVDQGIENGIEWGESDEGFVEGTEIDENIEVIPSAFPIEEDSASYDDDPVSVPDTTATDSRGIPGWDKVDKLAQVLLEADGISITDAAALKVIEAYKSLDEFDKKPIEYKAVCKKPVSGRFAQRKRGGEQDVVRMKRSFLSSAFPALSPQKSRVVEAICMHLAQKIPSHTKEGSRYSLILREYRKIQARVLNSQELLQNTGITLFNINETTLRNWLHDQDRAKQVKLLLQARDIHQEKVIAKTPLPPTREKPTLLEGQGQAMEFIEPEDTSGKAKMKYQKKRRSKTMDTGPPVAVKFPITIQPITNQQQTNIPPDQTKPLSKPIKPLNTPIKPKPQTLTSKTETLTSRTEVLLTPCQPQNFPQLGTSFIGSSSFATPQTVISSPTSSTIPRSTFYRHLKKSSSEFKQRKTYCCRKCGQPTKDGNHKQVRGSTYCPFKSNVTFEEFKEKRLMELEEKKK